MLNTSWPRGRLWPHPVEPFPPPASQHGIPVFPPTPAALLGPSAVSSSSTTNCGRASGPSSVFLLSAFHVLTPKRIPNTACSPSLCMWLSSRHLWLRLLFRMQIWKGRLLRDLASNSSIPLPFSSPSPRNTLSYLPGIPCLPEWCHHPTGRPRKTWSRFWTPPFPLAFVSSWCLLINVLSTTFFTF